LDHVWSVDEFYARQGRKRGAFLGSDIRAEQEHWRYTMPCVRGDASH
jgi:hypothetical protein